MLSGNDPPIRSFSRLLSEGAVALDGLNDTSYLRNPVEVKAKQKASRQAAVALVSKIKTEADSVLAVLSRR